MSKKKYVETEYARIPFYCSWWTFGWGLFGPNKIADLISAITTDQSAATNKRHVLANLQHAYNLLHERYKSTQAEAAQLRAQTYFVPPEIDNPGQTWEDVCKEYMAITGVHNKTLLHRESVLKTVKLSLRARAAKAKKAGKPYKWMEDMAKDIDDALAMTAEDLS